MHHRSVFRFSLLSTIVCSSFALVACQQTPHMHGHQTSHIIQDDKAGDAHKAHWGYGEEGSVAPAQWGDMEVNKLCKLGQEQSPINVKKVYKEPATDKNFNLKQHFVSQNFKVENNGHTVVFKATNPKASKISVAGKVYKLLQFHYHIPSEHTVMNSHYPLEIHFVHQSSDGQLAVVGVLYKESNDNNSAFNKVLANLPKHGKASAQLTQFNVSTLMPKNQEVYAYNGSLTTPPCSEKVQWLLKSTPVTIGRGQLQQLGELYYGNNRPVQPQNSRKVHIR